MEAFFTMWLIFGSPADAAKMLRLTSKLHHRKKTSYANRLSCLVRVKERDILYTAEITSSIVTIFIFCKIMLNNILVNDVTSIPLIIYR
jgi:hypothetical protein